MTQRFDHGKANADFVRVDAARVEEFGAVCTFFSSAHVGYVIAQNILLDGGRYPGLF
jgi:hypothetical protein